ncbi:MAG: hypothetical protein K2X77_09425 [Candidatus Obscuribacterales bacterium]|jgi:hypothetical protein|nr:hypothetical protein [Candidatus Obscuribacterales bacterium]
MGLLIGPIEFEGPFADFNELRDDAGIYALLAENGEDLELIELEDSNSVKDCLFDNEFSNNLRFFQETAKGQLFAAVHYTPGLTAQQRRDVRLDLLREFEP